MRWGHIEIQQINSRISNLYLLGWFGWSIWSDLPRYSSTDPSIIDREAFAQVRRENTRRTVMMDVAHASCGVDDDFCCLFDWFGSRHLVFDWRLLGNPDVLVIIRDSRVRNWLWLGKVLAPLAHPNWGKLLRGFDIL